MDRAMPFICPNLAPLLAPTQHVRRCHLAPGAAAPAAGICTNEADAARPAVVVTVVALNNESFGIIRDHGLVGKGPRGLDGFLGMLAEQVRVWVGVWLGVLVSRGVWGGLGSVCIRRGA